MLTEKLNWERRKHQSKDPILLAQQVTISFVILSTLCSGTVIRDSTSFISSQPRTISKVNVKTSFNKSRIHLPFAVKDAAMNSISCLSVTSRNYANGKSSVHGESSSSLPMSDFERRMRNRVRNEAVQMSKARKSTFQLPPNVRVAKTTEEFRDAVLGEKHRLVATRFYAPYCKACKAIEPYFYRLATMYPDVSFVEVPISAETTDLFEGLNIPSIPFGHIYHPEAGLVEQRRITKKRFRTFQIILNIYVQGMWETKDFDYSDPFIEPEVVGM